MFRSHVMNSNLIMISGPSYGPIKTVENLEFCSIVPLGSNVAIKSQPKVGVRWALGGPNLQVKIYYTPTPPRVN